jgi:hypothetical protein
MVSPIGVVFPTLFQFAAHKLSLEQQEEKLLHSLQVSILRKTEHSGGLWILRFSYAFLSLWVAGAIFLCLVFGMQVCDARGDFFQKVCKL